MNSILFPPDFFDRPGLSDLPVESKLVAAVLAVHPVLSPCLVFTASRYSCRGIPLPFDSLAGVFADLHRRALIAWSADTGEAYFRGSFDWHRAPTDDDDSPWARQVRAALTRLRDPSVAAAVAEDLAAAAGQPRISAILVHANLLTALPPRAPGQNWTATEMLCAYVLASNPDQCASGVFRPVGGLDSLAALASVPPGTMAEVVKSLAAAGVAAYDETTCEAFVASRLRCARGRDHRQIFDEALLIESKTVFKVFSSACRRLKIKIPDYQPPSSQERGGDVITGDVTDWKTGRKFGLRHGPFR